MGKVEDKKEIFLHPTHTCFEDSTQFMFEQMKKDRSIIFEKEWKYVHAIVKKEDGSSYSHCWVEHNDTAFISGILDGEIAWLSGTRAEIYKLMRIVELKRYTIQEAFIAEKKAGHPPPWEERFRKLCSDIMKERGTG